MPGASSVRPKIDVHTHFALVAESRAILEEHGLARHGGNFSGVEAKASAEVNRRQMEAITPRLTNLQEKIREMDRMGIDIAVISPPPYFFFYWTPPAVGLELARMHNDRCAQYCRASPRFLGMATLPLQDVSCALGELRRAQDDLGLRGIAIGSNIAGQGLDDPTLDPFWAEAASRKMPVFVHPVSVAGADRMQPYYLTNLLGNPMDTTIAAARLIYGGVLTRHPDLRIVLAHCGGAFPFLRGRIEAGWKLRPECRHLPVPPRETYAEQIYLDCIAHDPLALDYAVRAFGANRVVIGSDMPFDIGEEDIVRQVEALSVCASDLAAILAGNATRLFGIA